MPHQTLEDVQLSRVRREILGWLYRSSNLKEKMLKVILVHLGSSSMLTWDCRLKEERVCLGLVWCGWVSGWDTVACAEHNSRFYLLV